MASERDPRVDPRPGDVLIYGPQWQSCRSEVIAVTAREVFHAIDNCETAIPVPVHKWRIWMKSAEILKRGEE